MKRFWTGLVVGVLATLCTVAGFDLARYVTQSPAPSTTASSLPLEPLEVDPSWISEGDPAFSSIETSRSPDGRTLAGVWECTGPTTFTWQFGWDETVYVIDGEVEVEYLGETFTLAQGDSAVFHANTEATWHIENYLLKSYTLYRPSIAGRAWRMVVREEA